MKKELTWKLLKKYIQFDTIYYHYDKEFKIANFYSNVDNDISDVNDWLLEYFPHYLGNIDFGICRYSDNHRNNPSGKNLYLSVICVESGFEEVA